MTTPTVSRFDVPDLGVGVGFRVPHYGHVLEHRPPMDWFEVISENFMVDGGSPLHHLERLVEHYPVVNHGVSISLGGTIPQGYLPRYKQLLDRVNPPWSSDHLCWTGSDRINAHELLPLPYTPPVAQHVVDNIKRVLDATGRVFAIENTSSYMTYNASVMPEWEFLSRIVDAADCAIMLDVNNIFVSSHNHGFDPVEFLDALPHDRVVQIHLAGHMIADNGHRLDTHDHPVCDEVWDLYRRAIRHCGPVSTLIEWDDHIPSWERLSQEAATARRIRQEVLAEREASHAAAR